MSNSEITLPTKSIPVSILVPVYNVEFYLEKCLNSIISQSLKNIEIICINDGSTDNSLNILKSYAKKDERIRIINKKNTGYGNTLNVGLDAAYGEYIGIVESDDFIEPDMFETLYSAAKEKGTDVVISNFFRHVDDVELRNGDLLVGFNGKILTDNNVFSLLNNVHNLWMNIYNRKFLFDNEIKFNETPGAAYQDTAFLFKVFSTLKSAYYINKAHLHYRLDNTNSSTKSGGKLFCICDEYDEIEKFLEKHIELKEKLKYFVEFLKFNSYIWNFGRPNLNWSSKIKFLDRVASEFLTIKENGLLNEKYWSPSSWNNMNLILTNSDEYLYTAYMTEQKKEFMCYGIKHKIRQFSYIIIFDTNAVSQQIAAMLRLSGICVSSFAVNSNSNNISSIMSIPVKSIKSFLGKSRYALIFLPVIEEKNKTNVRELLCMGFENLIIVDMEILSYLRDDRFKV